MNKILEKYILDNPSMEGNKEDWLQSLCNGSSVVDKQIPEEGFVVYFFNDNVRLLEEKSATVGSTLVKVALTRLLVKLKKLSIDLNNSKTEDKASILGKMVLVVGGLAGLGSSQDPRSIMGKINAVLSALA